MSRRRIRRVGAASGAAVPRHVHARPTDPSGHRFRPNAPRRLAGVGLPAFPETDASFAEAKARIAKPLDFIKGFGPAQIDGTGEKDISWKADERPMSFKGQAYLLHFCLPHFFFHCTTAYNILRHNGVELGKRDYMGSL